MDGRRVPLTALLGRLPAADVSGNQDLPITGIAIDSRAVKPGELFVALRGTKSDGHHHAADAVAAGAAAVVVERVTPVPASATVVTVADSRRALSLLAAAFYDDPSRSLDAIGITGTNGKTSVAHMVAAIFDAGKIPCGIIGTVGAEFRSRRWRVENTTPQPPELQALLAQMRDDGAKAVAMEVSSHALALGRVDDVRLRVAALTNVTRDHLDFHETLEAYAAAKRRLFELAPAAVLNLDDAYGARWAGELRDEGREVVTYGTQPGALLAPADIEVASDATRFTLDRRRFELQVGGRFNVWNALAAIGVARLCGIDDATSARGLAAMPGVPGRMERLSAGGVNVVVDYAHTPDALENVLRALRETTSGSLAVVFGCGGDRDRGKRAEMGAVAARHADRIYLTSDNPRSEEPQAIVDAIERGVGGADHVVELDRRRAIERAIAEARASDVVLIAGKGHETYQIVGERVLPFDDAAVAREALARR